jgi:hypothetical protein
MSLTFPLTCGIGHSDLTINSDTELISHHTSEHKTQPIADYRKSLGKAKVVTLPPPAPKSKPHASSLARFGLTKANFAKISRKECCSGGTYGESEFQAYLIFLGELHSMEVSGEKLLLDIFIFLLEHGGTDDVDGLGGLTLKSNDGTSSDQLPWTTFKKESITFWNTLNIKFTFRRFVRSFDGLFWELWNEPSIVALDEIRQNGTALSREWRMRNGESPPAYALVPGLFSSHLKPEEQDIRRAYGAIAKLDKGTTGELTHTGVDVEGEVDAHVASRVATESAARNMRLWKGQGGSRTGKTGVGSHPPPTVPGPWSSYLNGLSSVYS